MAAAQFGGMLNGTMHSPAVEAHQAIQLSSNGTNTSRLGTSADTVGAQQQVIAGLRCVRVNYQSRRKPQKRRSTRLSLHHLDRPAAVAPAARISPRGRQAHAHRATTARKQASRGADLKTRQLVCSRQAGRGGTGAGGAGGRTLGAGLTPLRRSGRSRRWIAGRLAGGCRPSEVPAEAVLVDSFIDVVTGLSIPGLVGAIWSMTFSVA